jgi:hypothetical protein
VPSIRSVRRGLNLGCARDTDIPDAFLPLQDSPEAKFQEDYEAKKKEDTDAAKKTAMDEAVAAGEADFVVDAGGAKNSFDYSDRAAQTFNNPMRERGVATEPPPVLQYSATCTQWEIYDSYMDHYKRELADQDSGKVRWWKGQWCFCGLWTVGLIGWIGPIAACAG